MKDSLSRHGLGLIALLIFQYLLGMYTNMFVQFPEHANDGQMWEFSWRQISIALHIITGFSLLIGGIVLIVRSFKTANTSWRYPSIIGTIAIAVAIFAGARFIPTQTDSYSFLMSICFIIAFASFCWGIYSNKK